MIVSFDTIKGNNKFVIRLSRLKEILNDTSLAFDVYTCLA